MSEQPSGLTPDQLRAVNFLAGAKPDGAEPADIEPEAVAGWSGDDPEFIAELNRAKAYRTERLRAELRSLYSDAMASVRDLVSRFEVAPSVRLRASRAILEAISALRADEVGPTRAEGVQANLYDDKLIEALGG